MPSSKKSPVKSALKFAERLLPAALFLFVISTPAADAPTIAGQWNIHQSIAGNENDEDCTFTVSDGKIAGTCKVNDQTPKVTGTVEGKKLAWQYDIEYNGNTLTLSYAATLDDADKFSGTVNVAPYGVSGDFTAQRVKPSK
jgi:hypothetical protein